MGGDPDLPLCTGRVHNQLNLPPWSLPGQAALSGFRSRELTPEGGNSAAGRSNHLILDDTEAKIQAQLKSDHQHSQLSLGHITRIEDNAGRQDARGEGFELRTDGHGAIRANDGLMLTTQGRERARAHVKDIDETLHHLTRARDQHETLASLAEQHKAQEAGADQSAVSEALKAQNQELRGSGNADAAVGRFPELAAPHMLLASAAGITASATSTMDLNAGRHIATTSGGHTSISSAKSFLASALESVRLFAHQAGVRIFAGKGAVQIQAQDDMVELIAKRAVEIISTTDWVRLKAKEGIALEVPGSSITLSAAGVQIHTTGVHHAWAADHQTFGPRTLVPVLPELPTSVCIPCLLKAARSGSAIARL